MTNPLVTYLLGSVLSVVLLLWIHKKEGKLPPACFFGTAMWWPIVLAVMFGGYLIEVAWPEIQKMRAKWAATRKAMLKAYLENKNALDR